MHEIHKQLEAAEAKALASAPAAKVEIEWYKKWSAVPANLATRTQLRADRLKPGGPVRAKVRGRDGYYDLYDRTEAVAIRPVSEKQAAALAEGRKHTGERKCRVCGEYADIRFLHRKGQCPACELREKERDLAEMWRHDRDAAIQWARECMAHLYCVIIDTETTGLDYPYAVQIAVIDMNGRVLFDNLIKPPKPIEEGAIAVHGITEEMVSDAPSFPQVWDQLRPLLAGRVIAYNVDFDHQVITNGQRQADPSISWYVPTPKNWQCAMLEYSAYFGEWSDYHNNWRWQRLQGGDHSALGDCQATLRLIKDMAAARLSTEGE
jgi:DNA polymerase-3 subunit epsilon